MRPVVLAAVGVACLGVAAAIGAAFPREGRGDAAASLGGARVLFVDALFLHAEALAREGRTDELPAIYRRILELDPTSDTAIDYLAATEVHDLLPLAPSEEARVRWWAEATVLVEEGLARNPRSARLHHRAADLLWHVPEQEPAVARRLDAAKRDRLFEALAHLVEAARLTDSLPRLGFAHLEGVVRLAPRLAAERLARGAAAADVEACLALGREVLALRAEELASFRLGDDPADPASAGDRLRAGLTLVEHVRDAPGGAKGLLETYVSVLGRDAVARALSPLVPR